MLALLVLLDFTVFLTLYLNTSANVHRQATNSASLMYKCSSTGAESHATACVQAAQALDSIKAG